MLRLLASALLSIFIFFTVFIIATAAFDIICHHNGYYTDGIAESEALR